MQSARNDRSLGELFGDLTSQTSTLVRGEIAMAKAELTESAKQAAKGAGTIAVGGALVYAGLLALVGAVILLLAIAMPAWLAAVIVGVVVAAIGGGVLQKGRAVLSHADMAPHQTMATLATDIDMVKGERV